MCCISKSHNFALHLCSACVLFGFFFSFRKITVAVCTHARCCCTYNGITCNTAGRTIDWNKKPKSRRTEQKNVRKTQSRENEANSCTSCSRCSCVFLLCCDVVLCVFLLLLLYMANKQNTNQERLLLLHRAYAKPRGFHLL